MMAREQNSILIILGLLAAIVVAFWLGRQSVLQTENGTLSSTGSQIEAITAPPTTEPNTAETSESASQDIENAVASANNAEELAELATSDEQKRLLTDIDLAGIEPETLEIYLKAWELLDRDFYGKNPDSTERIYASIRGLLQSYDDPYTFFIEPKTNEIERGNLRGSFAGIGAYVEPSEDGFRLRPMRDQPAAVAGVQENDLLIAVDDKEINADMPADDVALLIRGNIDTDVTITILRSLETDSAEELSFTITRAEIQTPSMDWRMISSAEFPSEQWVEPTDLQRIDKIGYIRHHIFSDRSPIEMRTALDELSQAGAKYFILDLRGNPGGPVNAVIQATDLWISSGGIMQEKNAQGQERTFEATADVAAGDEPLLIIVDGGSASASEILAGALQDNERATLLGEKTFGKGSVQIIYPLPDQSSIHITNATWFTPDGHVINKLGLQPDISIEAGTDPIPQGIGALLDLEWALPVAEVEQ